MNPPDGSSIFGLSQRLPPANLQAEQALLGALLANNKSYERVGEFLEPQHFADPVHGRIYDAIRARIDAGRMADAVSLKGDFEHSGVLEEVGGIAYLAQLLTAMVGIINAGEYGRTIFDAWVRRQLIDLGETLVNDAFAPPGSDDGTAVAMRVFTALDKVLAGNGTERPLVTFNAALDRALERADKAADAGGFIGLSTGMPKIDDALGGLLPGNYIILAARPGQGKSALGMQWAVNVARWCRDDPARGGVFVQSLEMEADAIGMRTLSEAARVPNTVLRHGKHWIHKPQLEMARAELHDLPLLIDDAAGLTMKQIRLRARRASRAFGGKLALVVIDHLHIVAADERDRDRGDTQAMGQISASVKRLAKEFNCPVLALAQLNRGVESRDDKRPNLSDLRQSGNLEQDADAVIFLFRAEYYLRDETPERKGGETQATYDAKCRAQREKIADAAGKGEAIFAKVREGATRTVHLTWHAETTSFEDSYQ